MGSWVPYQLDPLNQILNNFLKAADNVRNKYLIENEFSNLCYVFMNENINLC